MPERLRRPESLLMMLALMASLGMHMPPWLGLGALADYFEAKERAEQQEKPSEPITFDVTSDPEPDKPDEPEKLDAPKPPPPKKPEPQKKEAQKKPEPEKPKQAVKVVPKPAEPLPEPPKQERKQSITQKSEDPNVEPPPDAKFLAEESRRVEEESVASVTSETKNDPDLRAAAPQAADQPEKSGDSRENERGAEKGARDEQQQQAASRQRSAEPATPRPPAPQEPTAPTPGRPGQQPTQTPRAEAPEQVVRDPLGSFVLAPSTEPAPSQEGTSGAARSGARKNLKVSWRAFEDTFGAEQLAQDRLPREAKRLGAGREKRWGEFRAAIENYVVGVKPGNTTALNAAADPFAAYLAAFHRNLHMEFAHDFLAGLPLAGEMADPELVTKVEIVVNADGSLDRVGVVKSSGNLMYDFGAFNAVQRGAPYPPTPEKIRSPDGRVYLRWALHRNESQCGTWNAEPFMLKNPPRSPNDPRPDNVSPYRNGSGESEGTRDEPRKPPGKQAPITPGETLGLHDLRVRRVRAG